MPQQEWQHVKVPAIELKMKSSGTYNAYEIATEHNSQDALCMESLNVILLRCCPQLSFALQTLHQQPEQASIFLAPLVVSKQQQQPEMC